VTEEITCHAELDTFSLVGETRDISSAVAYDVAGFALLTRPGQQTHGRLLVARAAHRILASGPSTIEPSPPQPCIGGGFSRAGVGGRRLRVGKRRRRSGSESRVITFRTSTCFLMIAFCSEHITE
jgi:hypothetical protein